MEPATQQFVNEPATQQFVQMQNSLATSNLSNETIINAFRKISDHRLYRIWLKALCEQVNSSLFKQNQLIDKIDLQEGDYFEVIKLRDNSIKPKTIKGVISSSYHLMILIIRERNKKMEWTTLGFGPNGWCSPDMYFLNKCEKLIKEHFFIESSNINNNKKSKLLKTFVDKKYKNKNKNKKFDNSNNNLKNIKGYVEDVEDILYKKRKRKIINLLYSSLNNEQNNYEQLKKLVEKLESLEAQKKFSTNYNNFESQFIETLEELKKKSKYPLTYIEEDEVSENLRNQMSKLINKLYLDNEEFKEEYNYLIDYLFLNYSSEKEERNEIIPERWSIKSDIEEIDYRDDQKISVLASGKFTKSQIKRLKNLIKMQTNNSLSKLSRTEVFKFEYLYFPLLDIEDNLIWYSDISFNKSNLYASPTTSFDNFLKFIFKFLPEENRNFYSPFTKTNKYIFSQLKNIDKDFYAHNCASAILYVFPKLIKSTSPIISPATIKPILKNYKYLNNNNKNELFKTKKLSNKFEKKKK